MCVCVVFSFSLDLDNKILSKKQNTENVNEDTYICNPAQQVAVERLRVADGRRDWPLPAKKGTTSHAHDGVAAAAV